jgi:hypothetical protein
VRHRSRELENVSCSADVHAKREFAFDREIVNCGEMKGASRLFMDQRRIFGRQTQTRLTDIAFDQLKILDSLPAYLRKARNFVSRSCGQCGLDQKDETAIVRRSVPEKAFQQAVGDKTRKPGYEECFAIRHQLG